jgi:hypothetical protein
MFTILLLRLQNEGFADLCAKGADLALALALALDLGFLPPFDAAVD